MIFSILAHQLLNLTWWASVLALIASDTWWTEASTVNWIARATILTRADAITSGAKSTLK